MHVRRSRRPTLVLIASSWVSGASIRRTDASFRFILAHWMGGVGGSSNTVHSGWRRVHCARGSYGMRTVAASVLPHMLFSSIGVGVLADARIDIPLLLSPHPQLPSTFQQALVISTRQATGALPLTSLRPASLYSTRMPCCISNSLWWLLLGVSKRTPCCSLLPLTSCPLFNAAPNLFQQTTDTAEPEFDGFGRSEEAALGLEV